MSEVRRGPGRPPKLRRLSTEEANQIHFDRVRRENAARDLATKARSDLEKRLLEQSFAEVNGDAASDAAEKEE